MARLINEIEARQTIKRWRESGLGVAEFMKREGISAGRLYRMRDKVEGRAAATPGNVPVVPTSKARPGSTLASRVDGAAAAVAPCIVPVVVRPGSMPASAASTLPFEVELGSGMKIRVASGFDAAELVRLLEALAGVRC